MRAACGDRRCGAIDCPACHPELQEKKTCPCCGEAKALWAMSAVHCGGCGGLICGECVETAPKVDGKAHCPACAKTLDAQFNRDFWRGQGYTEECIFEGEYRLLTNPKNLNKVRIYDNGDVWMADPKTGEYMKLSNEIVIADALFIEAFERRQLAAHDNAVSKGFYDRPPSEGEAIALMHSELSEMLDGVRHGNPPSEHIPEFSAAEEELADTVIRAMDWAGHKGYRLAQAIVAKMAYNATRPHMHGGKKF